MFSCLQRTLTLQELEAQLLAPRSSPSTSVPTPPRNLLQRFSNQPPPGQPQMAGSPLSSDSLLLYSPSPNPALRNPHPLPSFPPNIACLFSCKIACFPLLVFLQPSVSVSNSSVRSINYCAEGFIAMQVLAQAKRSSFVVSCTDALQLQACPRPPRMSCTAPCIPNTLPAARPHPCTTK